MVVVKPETLIGWHRKALLMFWRWKSREGRPRLPKDLRALIAEMVRENPMSGEMRVALELGLKLGIRVSPRTVGDWPQDLKPRCCPYTQRRTTLVRNHPGVYVPGISSAKGDHRTKIFQREKKRPSARKMLVSRISRTKALRASIICHWPQPLLRFRKTSC